MGIAVRRYPPDPPSVSLATGDGVMGYHGLRILDPESACRFDIDIGSRTGRTAVLGAFEITIGSVAPAGTVRGLCLVVGVGDVKVVVVDAGVVGRAVGVGYVVTGPPVFVYELLAGHLVAAVQGDRVDVEGIAHRADAEIVIEYEAAVVARIILAC